MGYTTLVTVTSDDPANPVHFTEASINIDCKNLKFLDCQFDCTTRTTAPVRVALNGSSTFPLDGVTWERCKFVGPTLDTNDSTFSGGVTIFNRQEIIKHNGTKWNSNLQVLDCTFRYVENAVSIFAYGTCAVSGNLVDAYWAQAIQVTYPLTGDGAQLTSLNINDNVITRSCSKQSDTNNPHPDYILITGRSTQETDFAFTCDRNICFIGDARGQGGPIAARDTGATKFFVPSMTGNLVVTIFGGIEVESSKNGVFKHNAALSLNNGSATSTIQLRIGMVGNSGTQSVIGNVAEVINVGGTWTNTDNDAIGADGATHAYGAVFKGIWQPSTLAQCKVIYAAKVGGPADISGTAIDQGPMSGAVTFASANPGRSGAANNV